MNKIWLGFFIIIIKLKHMASWHETELYLKNSCKCYPEKLEICPLLGTICINKLSWFWDVASNRNFNFWLIGTSKVFTVQLLFNFGLPVSNGLCGFLWLYIKQFYYPIPPSKCDSLFPYIYPFRTVVKAHSSQTSELHEQTNFSTG